MINKMGEPFSNKEKTDIGIDYTIRGLSMRTIASKHGRTPKGIENLIYKTLGLKKPKKNLSPLQQNEAEKMKLDGVKDKDFFEEAARRGLTVTKTDNVLRNLKYKFPTSPKPIKIGVVSDVHFGSIYQQPTALHDFYKFCEERGVQHMFNVGDVVEGNGQQYRGQIYEMFVHGADQIEDYIVANYPSIPDITTYFIGGSHDNSFWKTQGYSILKHIGDKRKDMKFLGLDLASITIGKVKITLQHGSGGVAYARSYKMQKIINDMPPRDRPHILLLGHYHVPSILPRYAGVYGFQLECFQAQTSYLKGKGLHPSIAGIILTIHHNKKGVVSIEYEDKTYEPLDHDY